MHQCDNNDNGGKLYQYVQQIFKDYIQNEALRLIKQRQDQGQLIEGFLKAFDNYAMLAKLMDRMFDYLNRYFLKNQNLKSIGITAMEIFVSKCYEQVKDSLRNQLLNVFTQDRNGKDADESQLAAVIKTYVQMGLTAAQPQRINDKYFWEGSKNLTHYENEFEVHFLTRAREEYDNKAKKWISECTAPEYLTLADQAFDHEERYCAALLQPETRPKLMKRVENELISRRN